MFISYLSMTCASYAMPVSGKHESEYVGLDTYLNSARTLTIFGLIQLLISNFLVIKTLSFLFLQLSSVLPRLTLYLGIAVVQHLQILLQLVYRPNKMKRRFLQGAWPSILCRRPVTLRVVVTVAYIVHA